MKVAVGGRWQDYRLWCRQHDMVPGRDIVYADSVEKLMGLELKPDDIVRLGSVPEEMEAMLLTRIR